MRIRKQPMRRDREEAIALAGLTFLAEDGPRLGRFLALTGMGPQDVRDKAGSDELLAAVLTHLLEDESLLLAFAGMKGFAPEEIAPAHTLLAGPHASDTFR